MSFNPRSPRGGATRVQRAEEALADVSIHAPREGERQFGFALDIDTHEFQSTLPARGSDHGLPDDPDSYMRFNPRSPRGGATILRIPRFTRSGCFNPRSPR